MQISFEFVRLSRSIPLEMVQVRNLGKPVELAGRYFNEGADEVSTNQRSLLQGAQFNVIGNVSYEWLVCTSILTEFHLFLIGGLSEHHWFSRLSSG